MSDKKTEALMSIEDFETEVKKILKKPFEIAYDSEEKDYKALTVYLYKSSVVLVDAKQSTWQETFKQALNALKEHEQSEA